MYKLIAFDLDGTILPHGEKILPIENVKMIKQLKENGYTVVFVTGREWVTIGDLINTEGVDYFIGANGTFVYDIKNKQTLFERNIKFSDWKNLQTFCEGININYTVITAHSVFFRDKSVYKNNWFWNQFYDLIKPIKELTKDSGSIHQISIRSSNIEKNQQILDFVKKEPNMTVNSIWDDATFIGAEGVTKAFGLQHLCKTLGISMKNIIAFGDGANDFEMLAEAGLGVAMGNGLEKAKEVADETCDTDVNLGPLKKLQELKMI